jgi:hypothetical protein
VGQRRESVDFVLVQAGANSAIGHHRAGEAEFRNGEPVLIDIAARRDAYFAAPRQDSNERGDIRVSALASRYRRPYGGTIRLPHASIF